ncbi:MAG: LemA family protein [Granulosicoccus sp.]
MSTSTILLIILGVVGIAGVILYNRLITLRNRFLNAFSQIDVQLQRRYELIPNLVETASAYMQHESETLTAVTQARNAASESCSKAAKDPADSSLVGALASAEKTLNGAMGKFNMVMENYPELKADAQMRDLHEELTSTENRVAFARQAYSDAVMIYNTAREQFPTIIVAGAFAFKSGDLFEVPDEEMKQAVKVSFAQSRAA